MYKVIKIDGTDYKLEYSFEAALYEDCTEAVLNIFNLMSDGDSPESIIKGMSNVPQTAITLFYAGLLEHHGDEVRSIADAKKLAIAHIKSMDGDGSFYGLLKECIDQMGEDGFFKLVGLDELMSPEEEPIQMPKTPQDHKPKTRKKATTVSEA